MSSRHSEAEMIGALKQDWWPRFASGVSELAWDHAPNRNQVVVFQSYTSVVT